MTKVKKTNYLVFIEAIFSNPNGDPDNDNAPRVDPDTGLGIITNQCLNRKIRNQIMLRMAGKDGYDIYIQNDAPLNEKNAEAYKELAVDKKAKKGDKLSVQAAKEYMLKKYFDVRTFGAVMSTGDFPAGRVTGAVQTSFATSLQPITVQEISLTRQAITSKDDYEKNSENTMGRKYVVPYGLYAFHVAVSSVQAAKNGFTEDDLKVYEDALVNMFEDDDSSARNGMAVRGIYRFTHEHELGNAPAWKLYDLVKVTSEVDYPRNFNDFHQEVDLNQLPDGITLKQLL